LADLTAEQLESIRRLQSCAIANAIDTAISVLTTVFHLGHPGSRSLDGLLARIASRILAYTISFVTTPRLLPGSN